MRLALAISVILHALLWGIAGLQVRAPLAAVPPPITVELVRPEEAPEPPKPDAPAPQQAERQPEAPAETPAETPAQQAKAEPPAPTEPQKQKEQPQPVPQQQPEPPRAAPKVEPQAAPKPAPEQTASLARKTEPAVEPKLASADPTSAVASAAPANAEPDGEGSGTWFDSPLMNVPVGYQSTERKAKLTEPEIAAFKAHLRSCWQPPAALADAPAGLNVVLRVAFEPSGKLAGEPALLAAPASAKGPVLMQTAKAALARCQATGVLPPGKYKEWKLLDLAFSPAGLTGLPKL
ncbi:hypothetical protein CCR97_01140 [Rhodoplanes elegans]|uniref:hypothetical protein n=1 Tax=Rhodoplanes elegans TaxID=29408 RepID=UPI000DABA4A7|nr:hypothetical protein [Rhodoplanes elegans]MBK5956827.1 hypothetical protein [Rhodoplanes elegans]